MSQKIKLSFDIKTIFSTPAKTPEETEYLIKNGDKPVFSKSSDHNPWLVEQVNVDGSALTNQLFFSIEETSVDRTLYPNGQSIKYTLVQWGIEPNELGFARSPDEMSLLDPRFHWTIANPFDVMLFKYEDKNLDSRISFNFSGSYEFGLFHLIYESLTLIREFLGPSPSVISENKSKARTYKK